MENNNIILPEFPELRDPPQQFNQSEEGVANLEYDRILQHSFIYLISGKPGSGESHLVSEMILNPDLYRGKFNKVIYVSPSRIHPDIEVDDEFSARVLTEDFITDTINTISEHTADRVGKHYNILFVLDDCVAQLNKLTENSIITNLFFNRRHIIPNCNVSIIVTTQHIKTLCPRLRSIATAVFLFNVTPKEIVYIQENITSDRQLIHKAQSIVNEYFNPEEYEFLYIETYPETELYYNFLEVY